MLNVDVLIVGGGLVGSSIAAALSSHPLAKGLSVLVVDPSPPDADKWPALSLRTSTITPSSKAFLEDIGVWSLIPKTRIAPFDNMFVWDHPSPLPRAGTAEDLTKTPVGTMFFEAADIEEEALGYVVDNDTLRTAMFKRMKDLADSEGKDLRISNGVVYSVDYGTIDNRTPETSSVGDGNERDQIHTHDEGDVPWPIVELDNGEKIRTRLIVACDGSNSKIRTLAAADWFKVGYDQGAVVSNVVLQEPTQTAYQRFVSTGPVAVLPVRSDDTSESIGNVIWTTTTVEAQALAHADDAVFLNELNIVLNAHEDNDSDVVEEPVHDRKGYKRRQGDVELWNMLARGLQVALPRFGGFDLIAKELKRVDPPKCTSVIGRRWWFPLSLGHAPRYVIEEKRTVLVGDAAHSVHPLAGQGVNLGFADAQSLTDCVASAVATGRDIGGEKGAPLMRYQRERMVSNLGMIGLLHSIQSVFDRQSPSGFRDLRRVGMSAVNSFLPLKKFILRAMR